jgi:hypothetical protein
MDFFYVISRHFWMDFPCPRDLQVHNPQPMPAPHKFAHEFWTPPPPDSWIFIAMALFQRTKMKGDVADNLVSRRHCSQLATD